MPFTIKCDETGNVQKEDVLTRYCSPEMDQVCVRFLKSLIFAHVKRKKVGQAILDRPTLQEEGYQLPMKQNKTVWNLVTYMWSIMPFERALSVIVGLGMMLSRICSII